MRFFAAFVDQELWEVVKLGIWERVHAGTVVLREGDAGDFFCVIIEGEMRVSKNKKLLTELGAGECFGEMAYLSLSGQHRGATVTAAAESRILRVRVADLEQASVSCRSKFDRAFIGILVDRLNLARSEEHTSELQSPCNLVCRLLLEKKNFCGAQPCRHQKTMVIILDGH